MRVIAGSARGMRLVAPKGMQTTRPTADRVKEALFSILGSRQELIGARVLDICAGTGSLGIEALSRGAQFCCFLEHDRNVAAFIEKNLVSTGFRDKADCVVSDALRGLVTAVRKHGKFDIIFFDPPYSASQLYETVISSVLNDFCLVDGGTFVVESSSQTRYEVTPDARYLVDRRIYGDTALDFFVMEDA